MSETVIRHARAKLDEKPKQKVFDFSDLEKMRLKGPEHEEAIAEATDRKNQAQLSLNLKYSRLVSYFDTKVYYTVYTDQIDTFAVMASGAGYIILLINPYFASSLELAVEDTAFCLLHEMHHVFMLDLCTPMDLMKNPTHEIAVEACNNHLCLVRLNRKTMPHTVKTDPATGKVSKEATGIDPHKLYREYAKAVDSPVAYEKFISTPQVCFSELMRMPNPPGESKKYQVCVHQSGSGVGNDSGSGEGLQQDEETISTIVREAIDGMMQDALKGDSLAREELLDLAAASEGASDKASKMWSDVGLGALRGETIKVRKVEWWSRWLRRVLGSKLSFGGKLVYPRKRAAVMRILGHNTPLMHRGPERTKRVVRAIDTSGSMSQDFLNRFFKISGQTSGVEWVDISFDAVVMPYVAGERVYGGGGTSFKVVQDYLEGNLEVNGRKFDGRYDAVVMVTDGYAPHIEPNDPSKWIWLITEGGDMWMDGKMACHRIDLPE